MKLRSSNSSRNTLLALLAIGSSALLHAQSLAITGVESETVGSTAIIPINTSGTASNVNTWADEGPASVGVFQMNGGAYYMKVTATGFTGALSPTVPSLMVVRTVDSQGLTDPGTLSVYVRPTTASTEWSLDLNYSFYSDSALLTPATITEFQLTSLDIDFAQRYYVQTADFNLGTTFTYNTSPPVTLPLVAGPTNITAAPPISGFTGFTATPASAVNDPRAAVSSKGTGTNFDIRLAHNNIALFMFEFRNPSSIVPEPTSALLATAGMALFGLRRRRSQGA